MDEQEAERKRRRKRRKFMLVMMMMLSPDKAFNHKPPRKHSMWVRSWLAARDDLGAYNQILRELRMVDEEHYRKYLRMNGNTFEYLLETLRPVITL